MAEFLLTPGLRTLLAKFLDEYARPVAMFNLLKFHKGMFLQYKYIKGFVEVFGPKYGAQPRLVKDDEEKWDIVGWIHYPGATSFGRMLEDEAYKCLDCKYKKGCYGR